MYERFSDGAREVLQLATQEAHRCHHKYLGTEHILLGIVKEGHSVAANILKNLSVAANILKNLDIDLLEIRLEVEKIMRPGPEEIVTTGRLPQTPRAKKVIEGAIAASCFLGHRYVGTEHILLGLLFEQEGVAYQVLTALGLTGDKVKDELLNLLGPTPAAESSPQTGYVSGWESFTPDPGICSGMRCRVCSENMEVQRNVKGPTSSAAVMAKLDSVHDHFFCKHAAEAWHAQALILLQKATSSPSAVLEKLLREEAADILRTRKATKKVSKLIHD